VAIAEHSRSGRIAAIQRSWLRRPAVIVAVFYTAIVIALLATHEWDARFFATLGPQWQRHDPGLSKRADGSIYYAFATDPRGAAEQYPRARTARVLYPMAARVLALGSSELVPWTLVLVNVLAIVLGTEVLHRLLERRHLPSWAALAYGGWVGLGLALLHDTGEPISYLCALLGIAWLERSRPALACAAFVAALLGRETTILLIAPYLLTGPDHGAFRWWLPTVVVLAGIGWGAYLALAGVGPWVGFTLWRLPLSGFLRTRLVDLPITLLYIVIPALVLAAGAGWALRRRAADPALWGLMLNALSIFLMPGGSAAFLWHSARLSTGLVTAALLAAHLATSAPRSWRILAVLWVTSASWTIAVTVRYLYWDVVGP